MIRGPATRLLVGSNAFAQDLGALVVKHRNLGVNALIEGLDLYTLYLSLQPAEVKKPLDGNENLR